MEKQLVVIQNVRGYCDEQGTAWLNAEDVARQLGFVQVHKERVTTGGYNYEAVRWERVNGYLREFADIGKENSNGEPVEDFVEVSKSRRLHPRTAGVLVGDEGEQRSSQNLPMEARQRSYSRNPQDG